MVIAAESILLADHQWDWDHHISAMIIMRFSISPYLVMIIHNGMRYYYWLVGQYFASWPGHCICLMSNMPFTKLLLGSIETRYPAALFEDLLPPQCGMCPVGMMRKATNWSSQFGYVGQIYGNLADPNWELWERTRNSNMKFVVSSLNPQ